MAASRPPSFQALYNRYRPQRFDELIGQEHVVRTLQNALVHNRLSHAYLFSGERGTGKTTAARLLAKAVNCLEGIQAETCGSCDHCQAIANGSFLDLIEMDAASHRGIDDIREIRELTQFAPGAGRYRVYIIDEIHQLSPPAKDALLKTLEEPPPQTLFVLATTEPHRVPATIRSRTQHLTFRRIGVLELTTQLRAIAEAEGAQIDEAALHTLARNAGGSARDAVSLLDQALAYSDNDATADAVNAMLGLTGRDAVIQLLGRLIDGDAAAGLQAIGKGHRRRHQSEHSASADHRHPARHPDSEGQSRHDSLGTPDGGRGLRTHPAHGGFELARHRAHAGSVRGTGPAIADRGGRHAGTRTGIRPRGAGHYRTRGGAADGTAYQ